MEHKTWAKGLLLFVMRNNNFLFHSMRKWIIMVNIWYRFQFLSKETGHSVQKGGWNMLRITALVDNKPSENKALIAEHGLSLLAQYRDLRILFDCGSGANTLANAHRLGVDLRNLDAVVLSHSHYDHAAGFRDLTEAGQGSTLLYTGEHFFEPKFAVSGPCCTDLSAGFDRAFLENNGIQQREVTDVCTPFPGVHLISNFPRVNDFERIPQRFVRQTDTGFFSDDFADEICMALEVEGGLAVLVGCSHPGILNMMTHVRQVLGQPIRAVFGGTHLVEADDQRIDLTIRTLQDMGLEILGLSHCSGDAADCAICANPGVQGCHLRVGDNIFFD